MGKSRMVAVVVVAAAFMAGAVAADAVDAQLWSRHEAEATFNGTVDPASYWGWNVDANGLQAVAGENAFWLGLEADYDDGATHWIEANLDARAADGADRRFMAWRLNRATNAESSWAFVADDPRLGFRIENEMNAATFQFVPGSSTRNVQFALAGGRGELFQLGYDGGAHAPDGMSFGPSARGDGGGVNVWNVPGHPSNTQVGGGSRMGFGNAAGTFGIASTESPPTANPTGGGVLYMQGGALMYRGPSGTITRLAPG